MQAKNSNYVGLTHEQLLAELEKQRRKKRNTQNRIDLLKLLIKAKEPAASSPDPEDNLSNYPLPSFARGKDHADL